MFRPFFLFLALAAALAPMLEGQGRTLAVSAAPQCAACAIELTKVASVGKANDCARDSGHPGAKSWCERQAEQCRVSSQCG